MEDKNRNRTVKTQSEEEKLLNGREDRFGIYQVRAEEDLFQYSFVGIERLKEKGLPVDKKNYELVYTGSLSDFPEHNEERTQEQLLEEIYERFNLNHPTDYHAASVSVSDVIVLHRNGENSSHYVDRFGFAEVADFLPGIEVERTGQDAPEMYAVHVADRYISVQKSEDGFDYSVYDQRMFILDGGRYEDTGRSIYQVTADIIGEMKDPEQNRVLSDQVIGGVRPESSVRVVDPDWMSAQLEQMERDRRELSELFGRGFRPVEEGERTPFDDPQHFGTREVTAEEIRGNARDMPMKKGQRDTVKSQRGNNAPRGAYQQLSLRARLEQKKQLASQRGAAVPQKTRQREAAVIE